MMKTPEEIIGRAAIQALAAAGYQVVENVAPSRSLKADFNEWWGLYPNKVGKMDAEKAFAKARRLVSQQVLLDAVQRYAAKQDDRHWKNPGTWLRHGCWEDEEPQLQLPAPRSGLARVRATLEREISDGRLSRDQGAGGYVHGGLPLLAQRN